MSSEHWARVDRDAELCAAEHAIEEAGLGPARCIELEDGAIAVLDARGRPHVVLGPIDARRLPHAA